VARAREILRALPLLILLHIRPNDLESLLHHVNKVPSLDIKNINVRDYPNHKSMRSSAIAPSITLHLWNGFGDDVLAQLSPSGI